MPIVTFQPSGKRIEVEAGTTLLDAAREAGVALESPCGGEGACGDCAVRLLEGDARSIDTGALSPDRIDEGWVLACSSCVEQTPLTVEVPEQSLPLRGALAEDLADRARPRGEPATAEGRLGLAVDLGTTTVAVQLLSLDAGRALATVGDYNDQIECGPDIISRINYARKPGKLEELRLRAVLTINRLLREAASRCGAAPERVTEVHISGNTTMAHLLLGVSPESIRLAPYTPAFLEAPTKTAGELGLSADPGAPVAISPAVGSYVGGDITAGLLCTDMVADSEEIGLFMDIGTNGEMVAGNRDFLTACACSAGPAFEGGGIGCGMRAALGAIDRIEIDPGSGRAAHATIGNGAPRGICGSGMVSLLSGLFRTGFMDAAGKLTRDRECASIRVEGRRASYVVAPSSEAGAGKAIEVNETEIESVIRAKAAVYSACALMLDQVGIGFDDLSTLYIAGGFGRCLDIDNAVFIGLVPDLPRERFRYLGNASLSGTAMILLSSEQRERQQQTAHRMTYIELNTDPAYMDQYTGALFLPHTDIDRFPTVKRALHNP